MTFTPDPKRIASIKIRGKLGRPGLPDPMGIGGIYQVRRRGKEFVQVKEVYYKPSGIAGPGQLVQRNKMRVCVANWQAFTSDQKALYNKHAGSKQMTGFNWYLHTCLRFQTLVDSFLLLQNNHIILLEDGGKILI